MSKSNKEHKDHTKITSPLNRRLDSLAFILVGTSACVAVAIFQGRILVANNKNDFAFIEECLEYFKSVREIKNWKHEERKRQYLIRESLNLKMLRFRQKMKFQQLCERVRLINAKLDFKGTDSPQELCKFSNLVQEAATLAHNQKLDILKQVEVEKICKEISNLTEELSKAKEGKEKMRAETLIAKQKNDKNTIIQLQAQYKQYNVSIPGLEDKINSKYEFLYSFMESKGIILEKKDQDLQHLENLRVGLNDLAEEITQVEQKLNRCMSKLLKSLVGFNQVESKNFPRDLISIHCLPPKVEEASHSEMTIIQFIFDITSNFDDLQENIYIGNCLLACSSCDDTYIQVNKFLELKKLGVKNCLFAYRGNHPYSWTKWDQPAFFLKLGLIFSRSEKSKKETSSTASERLNEKRKKLFSGYLSSGKQERKKMSPETSQSSFEDFNDLIL